ncbi:MAG: TetR/AcrR family transcriptional regulator [Mycobacteriales bacterium]
MVEPVRLVSYLPISQDDEERTVVKPTRQSLTERRAEELRMALARTAMDLFVADGDTTATVEQIAEAAGVAPRTFYRHFAVKEDVVLPLFRRSSSRIAAAVRSSSPDVEVLEALVTAFHAALNDARVSRAQRSFLGLMMTNPQYRMRWLEVDEELQDAVAALLQDRLGLGADPFVHRLASHLLVSTAREVFEHWLTTDSGEGVDVMLRRGFGLVLAGIQTTVEA